MRWVSVSEQPPPPWWETCPCTPWPSPCCGSDACGTWPTPRQPTREEVAPAPPAFDAADVLAALGPMAVPPPAVPPPPAAPLPQYPDELAQMMGMGFGRGACLQALRACGGDVDAAIAIVLNM